MMLPQQLPGMPMANNFAARFNPPAAPPIMPVGPGQWGGPQYPQQPMPGPVASPQPVGPAPWQGGPAQPVQGPPMQGTPPMWDGQAPPIQPQVPQQQANNFAGLSQMRRPLMMQQ